MKTTGITKMECDRCGFAERYSATDIYDYKWWHVTYDCSAHATHHYEYDYCSKCWDDLRSFHANPPKAEQPTIFLGNEPYLTISSMAGELK